VSPAAYNARNMPLISSTPTHVLTRIVAFNTEKKHGHLNCYSVVK